MSKILCPPLQMESSTRCLRGCFFFFVPEEIVYSFLNFVFDIFWNSIYLTHVSQFGKEDLVYDYLITSQRESDSVPDMDFFIIPSLIMAQLELSRIELPTLSNLMENCNHSICSG